MVLYLADALSLHSKDMTLTVSRISHKLMKCSANLPVCPFKSLRFLHSENDNKDWEVGGQLMLSQENNIQ